MLPGQAGPLACAIVVCIPVLAKADGRVAGPKLVVALEYAAPSTCPAPAAFKAIVVARLGYDPFQENASDHVLAQITDRGRSLGGRLEWRDPAGQWAGDQNFPSRSEDCRDLARAMGFALAVQIQLMALEDAVSNQSPVSPPDGGLPPPAPAPSPTLPRLPEQAPVAVATATGPSAPRPPPVLALGAGATVASGISSGAVPVGRVFGAVAWTHLSLELAAEVSVPATIRRADGAGFSQQQLLASVAACGGSQWWSVCLLAKGGEIRITGLDIDVPASPSGPVFEAGTRLAASQRIGRRAYLAAHADGLAILTPWTVRLDQVPVWNSPKFALTFGLDAGVRFQ